MRFITFLVFFLSLCRYAAGQNIWQADSETTNHGVAIQNSLPKGGMRYTDPTGKDFVYAIFWTRVVNETTTPLELKINFAADSFAIASAHNYVKVFLPPDIMTYDKQPLFDYGLNLKSFLNAAGFHKPTRLQQTINPKEECVFYIAVLSPKGYDGAVRTGLVLKEKDLFYRINMLDPALIPCGRITFKK